MVLTIVQNYIFSAIIANFRKRINTLAENGKMLAKGGNAFFCNKEKTSSARQQ